MPRSRERGGTRMPRAGDDTTLPPMAISPPVGCSRPATQRSVVVLPQPDGPSSTTISPAGTAKLTPSIAGRPIANCLRRSVTSSGAVMISLSSSIRRSLPISVDLIPFGDPGGVKIHVVIELRQPDFDDLGIEAFRIERRYFERGKIAEFLDHEGLPLIRQAPVEEQLRCVGMSRGLWNSRRIGIDRHALGRKYDIERRTLFLLRVNRVVENRPHRHLAPHQRVRHRRTGRIEDRMGRGLLRPIILAEHLTLEHDAGPGGAT